MENLDFQKIDENIIKYMRENREKTIEFFNPEQIENYRIRYRKFFEARNCKNIFLGKKEELYIMTEKGMNFVLKGKKLIYKTENVII
ncbi:hypothetical protein [Caldiplasma sukawensis]